MVKFLFAAFFFLTTISTFAIINKPTVTTTVVSGIQYNSAIGGGEVTSTGTSAVTARGVCWDTSINPIIAINKLADGSTSSGSMISNVTGLTSGTTYYIRTYITVGNYTYYGPNVKFTSQ